MSDDYTPTTEEVRGWYGHRNGARFYNSRLTKSLSEFDRWLADHDAALIESLADDYEAEKNTPYFPRVVGNWFRKRAQQIREGKTTP